MVDIVVEYVESQKAGRQRSRQARLVVAVEERCTRAQAKKTH